MRKMLDMLRHPMDILFPEKGTAQERFSRIGRIEKRRIAQAAKQGRPIVITGRAGTGKTELARAALPGAREICGSQLHTLAMADAGTAVVIDECNPIQARQGLTVLQAMRHNKIPTIVVSQSVHLANELSWREPNAQWLHVDLNRYFYPSRRP